MCKTFDQHCQLGISTGFPPSVTLSLSHEALFLKFHKTRLEVKILWQEHLSRCTLTQISFSESNSLDISVLKTELLFKKFFSEKLGMYGQSFVYFWLRWVISLNNAPRQFHVIDYVSMQNMFLKIAHKLDINDSVLWRIQSHWYSSRLWLFFSCIGSDPVWPSNPSPLLLLCVWECLC